MSQEKLYQDWLEGRLTNDELHQKMDESQMKDQHLDQLIKMVEMAGQLLPPSGNSSKDETWNNISMKVDVKKLTVEKTSNSKSRTLVSSYWIGIAATLTLLLLAYVIFFTSGRVEYQTNKAQLESLVLPDGSTVFLNADSKLSYDESNWKSSRTIQLDGEAFFDVKKGSKFVVKSKMGLVSVLGTSFNVKARAMDYKVACFTGKVLVELNDGKITKTLGAGMATKFEREQLSDPFGFNAKGISGWKTGDFYFEKEPLKAVFEEFERQFDVNIQLETDVKGREYSGYFNVADKEAALALICLPMNLTYTLENNTIIIR